MNNTENLINYLGQLKHQIPNNLMSEPIDEVIKKLEMLEEIGKVYDISFFKEKYFPKPCGKIKQLEQFKAEFIKSEHSYYMERFMETCIKLFKEKEK